MNEETKNKGKKTPKEASNIFSNIIKASVKDIKATKEKKGKEKSNKG